MKNYISTVLSKINDKAQRKEIEAELQSHIQDRIDYYVNAGYDLEIATEKANERMGDTAELVGDQLNSLHKSKFSIVIVILFVFINIGVFPLLGLLFFFGHPDEWIINQEIGLSVSSVYILVVFLELFMAQKIRRSFLAFSCSTMCMFHGLFTLGYAPVVFCFYEIVVGKGSSLGELLCIYPFECGSIIAYVLSILFIVGSCLLSWFSAIQIKKFNNLENGKNFYKYDKFIKSTSLVLFALVLFVFLFSIKSIHNCRDEYLKISSCEGFYLIESDEMVNPEDIEDYDDKLIQYDYQLFSEDFIEYECVFYEEQYGWSEEKYGWDEDNDNWDKESYDKNYPIKNCDFQRQYLKYDDMNQAVKYRTDKMLADFYTDKRYVMIVPMLEDYDEKKNRYTYPDFSKGKWIEVSKKTVVKTEHREFRHNGGFLEYEITIIPKR